MNLCDCILFIDHRVDFDSHNVCWAEIAIIKPLIFFRLFSRGYFLSLNACMIAVGVSRGLFLLVDAYNEGGTFYSPLAYMLLNIGYPCITSAFAILFLALLRVTQVCILWLVGKTVGEFCLLVM